MMNKEIISNKQGITLMMLFIFGSTLVLGTGGEAKKDVWLAKIIGIILAIPVSMMYAKLLSMFEGKDIFDISKLAFGSFLGNIINLLCIWFALHIAALVLFSFSEFVGIVGLDKTPRVVFMGSLMFLCAWGAKEGIEVLGRWSEILLIFLIFIVFMTSTLAIPNFKFSNLLPVLQDGIKPVLKGAFSAFTFPFTETVIFTMVFSCEKDKKSLYKIYILGLLIAGFVLVITALRNILVLGSYMMSMAYYPSFNAVARINIGYFLQRLESASSIIFLISGFAQISVSLLGASKGISKLFNFKDYRFIVVPTALIVLNLGFLVSKDITELTKWNLEIFPYYGLIFELVLPSLIYICAKIRYKKINTMDNSEEM